MGEVEGGVRTLEDEADAEGEGDEDGGDAAAAWNEGEARARERIWGAGRAYGVPVLIAQ